MPTKPLWQSKTFWSDVVTIVVGSAMLSDNYFHTHIVVSALWTHAIWAAGLLGIYGRATADTQISGVI